MERREAVQKLAVLGGAGIISALGYSLWPSKSEQILRRHERTLGVLEDFVRQHNGESLDSSFEEKVYQTLAEQLSSGDSEAAITNLQETYGAKLSPEKLEQYMELKRGIMSYLREIVG